MAAEKTKTVVAFDLYGTILDTESISVELGKHIGAGYASDVALLWRRYQLEYTWRINSMGLYRDFGVITRGALRHALAEWDLHLSPADEETVMKAYDALRVSPEVPSALKAIEGNSLVEAVIFSNGTDAMVGASVESSPDLSPYHNLFKGLITVEELGVFKPNKRTYDHLLKAVGKEGSPEHVWLVSGNPFDIVGARAAGLQAAWIDRVGKGWVDCLGDVIGDIKPTVVVSGVDKAITEIIKTTSVGS